MTGNAVLLLDDDRHAEQGLVDRGLAGGPLVIGDSCGVGGILEQFDDDADRGLSGPDRGKAVGEDLGRTAAAGRIVGEQLCGGGCGGGESGHGRPFDAGRPTPPAVPGETGAMVRTGVTRQTMTKGAAIP